MLIPFVDLKIQYSEIKTELQRAIDGVLEGGVCVEGEGLPGDRAGSHGSLNLPMYPELSREGIETVAGEIKGFVG
jgi:hypothetical protein